MLELHLPECYRSGNLAPSGLSGFYRGDRVSITSSDFRVSVRAIRCLEGSFFLEGPYGFQVQDRFGICMLLR